jgi:hypothetical protein
MHQEGCRRVGQFGLDAHELAVKIAGPVLLMMGPVRDERHHRAVRAGHRKIQLTILVGYQIPEKNC